MNRWWPQLKLEYSLQKRNGFFIAVSFVAIIWIVLLKALPSQALVSWVPVIVLANLLISAYYFLAGLVLLDKTSGVLEALIVTPLKSVEFILIRACALAVLATLENAAVVYLGLGLNAMYWAAIPAIFMMALTFALFGYLNVIKYNNISEFLMPSMVYTLLMLLVVLPWFHVVPNWLIWLHPFGGVLLLLQQAALGILDITTMISFLVSMGWVLLLLNFARNKHFEFVSKKV